MANSTPKQYARLLMGEPSFAKTMPEARRAVIRKQSEADREEPSFPLRNLAARPKECKRIAAHNLRRALTLGVRVATGSDTFPAGANQHLEMLFLQEMGLSTVEVLRAATESGVASIGDTDAGRLREGGRADFVVLRANPLDRVDQLRRIEWVVKGGHCYTPQELFEGLP